MWWLISKAEHPVSSAPSEGGHPGRLKGQQYQPALILVKEGVAKGSEKKGTTKDTKSTKKSFSFP